MTPYFEAHGVTVFHGKAEDVLPSLPDHCADVGISDPPYSEHVHGKVRRGGGMHVDNKRASISTSAVLGFDHLSVELRQDIAFHSARLVKRWSLVFCDIESATDWRGSLTAVGLEYVRTGLWHKIGATPQFTGDRPAGCVEAVVIAHPKGRKRWNGGGDHALWSYSIVHAGPERKHTTQKPESLMSQLVQLFSDPGETVIDMTAGSGTTLVCALRLGRKAIGVEMSEAYCEVIAKRIEAEAAQGSMFVPRAKEVQTSLLAPEPKRARRGKVGEPLAVTR